MHASSFTSSLNANAVSLVFARVPASDQEDRRGVGSGQLYFQLVDRGRMISEKKDFVKFRVIGSADGLVGYFEIR